MSTHSELIISSGCEHFWDCCVVHPHKNSLCFSSVREVFVKPNDHFAGCASDLCGIIAREMFVKLSLIWLNGVDQVDEICEPRQYDVIKFNSATRLQNDGAAESKTPLRRG